MKKRVLVLLVGFGLFWGNALAQDGNYAGWNYKKKSDDLCLSITKYSKGGYPYWKMMDSSAYIYNLHDNIISEIRYERDIYTNKATYSYDENNHLLSISREQHQFDTLHDALHFSKYDSNNNIYFISLSQWSDSKQAYVEWDYATLTYDSLHREISDTNRTWNRKKNKSFISNIITHTYDAKNNMTSMTQLEWDKGKKKPYGGYREIKTFDEKNNETSRLNQWWDKRKNGFSGDIITYTNYIYDERGHMKAYSFLKGENHDTASLDSFLYDSLGNLTSQKYFLWDTAKKAFTVFNNKTYTYDIRNNVASILIESSYSSQYGRYPYMNKYTWNYDSLNNQIACLEEVWDYYRIKGFETASLKTVKYDSKSNITEDTIQVWDYAKKVFIDKSKTIYTYQPRNKQK